MPLFMISDLQRNDMPSDLEGIVLFLVVCLGVFRSSKPLGTDASITVGRVVSSFLNLILSLDWLLYKLIVKLVSKIICPQEGGTSLFNLPNGHRTHCMCLPLGSLRKLLICKAESIACLKSQIEMVLRGQDFLRGFFNDSADRLNERKVLALGVASGVNETECIHSLVVKDSSPWMHLLWLFDVTEEIQLIEKRIVGMKINQLRMSFLRDILNLWHDWLRKYSAMPGVGKTMHFRKVPAG